MVIKPISRSSLADDLTEQLAVTIRSGVYRPGDRLPAITSMAREFGVGHPTVRAALMKLEVLGLVDIKHGSGVYVRKVHDSLLVSNPVYSGPVSKRLLLDMVEARVPIEIKAVELAAAHATEKHLAAMSQHLADSEAAAADGDAVDAASIAFHEEIAAASGNIVLYQIQEILSRLCQRERRIILEIYGSKERDHAEHSGILEALRARDAELAVLRMQEHLDGVRDVLVQWDPDRSPVT